MMKIINEILNEMKAVYKPQAKFICKLIAAMLASHGKLNFRNMSRYSTFSEKTFSRNYRKNFDFGEFNSILISKKISSNKRLVAVYDQSFVSKSGKQTYGLGSFWNGSASKSERGLEVALLAVVDVDSKTAYALSASQTPPVPKEEILNDQATRIDVYLNHVVRDAHLLPAKIRHLAVDAYFSKQKFVHGVLNNTSLNIIGKLRSDANLRYIYSGEQKGRGRPRIFGEKFSINDLSRFDFFGTIDQGKIKLYTTVMYSVAFEMKVRVVVAVMTDKKGKAFTAILFSTDRELSALEIYELYVARFQIEFLFRDAKQSTGLHTCQARSAKSMHFQFNASFMALNISKFVYREEGKNVPFSMASIKSKHYNEGLIESFFSKLDFDQTLIKMTSAYQEALNYGVIHV